MLHPLIKHTTSPKEDIIMNTNTNAANVVKLPIISDVSEERILDALRTLHSVIGTYGAALPDFDDMLADVGQGTDQALNLGRITNRAHKALTALQQHRKEEEVRAFRQGVKEALQSAIEVQGAARDAFLALPKEVRQFMPSFPTTVVVPVSDMSDVFPTGTPIEAQVKLLHTMGYKVSKKDKAYHIVTELPTSASK
jgi:hypothetical protein